MLNAWRGSVGVQPVVHDPQQSDGCRRHSEYYRLNHQMGHFEDPGLPGYSPEGAAAAGSSVLSYGGDPADGPLVWEDAVYHRTGLLDPRLERTGYWAEYGIACMGVFGEALRTEPALTIHPYPYDGQRGVAASFGCDESPNPCTSVPGNDGDHAVGFILSVQFNGPWTSIAGPTVTAASVTGDGDAPTPLTVEDATSGRAANLDHGLALIPHQPLRDGHWYTAHVEGVLGARQDGAGGFEPPDVSEPFSRTWRFQTAIVPRDPELEIGFADRELTLSSLNPAPVTLQLPDSAGRPTRSRSVALGRRPDGRYGASVPFVLPASAWRLCAAQPGRPAEGWIPARTCRLPRVLRLRVRLISAGRRQLRVRVGAPGPARGRRATIAVRVAGRTRARRAVRLRRLATAVVRGRRLVPSRLRVTAPPFAHRGVAYLVAPATLYPR